MQNPVASLAGMVFFDQIRQEKRAQTQPLGSGRFRVGWGWDPPWAKRGKNDRKITKPRNAIWLIIFGRFQYGRFVATCDPRMNFTTFQTSHENHVNDDLKNNIQEDLAFLKKHFPFTKKLWGRRIIWHFRRDMFLCTKKMWEIMLRLDGPTCAFSVLILVPPF